MARIENRSWGAEGSYGRGSGGKVGCGECWVVNIE
jgi:hypothetical protein